MDQFETAANATLAAGLFIPTRFFRVDSTLKEVITTYCSVIESFHVKSKNQASTKSSDPRAEQLFVSSGGMDPTLIAVGSRDEAKELVERVLAIAKKRSRKTQTGETHDG
jgi:hypothetical protein